MKTNDRIMKIIDEFGIIRNAEKILPEEYKLKLISVIAELEDQNNFINKTFPISRLHKIKNFNIDVYRADIDKISGWRIHMQLAQNSKNTLILKQIVEGQKHDDCLSIVKAQKYRYNTEL